jgi:hypothetical protein
VLCVCSAIDLLTAEVGLGFILQAAEVLLMMRPEGEVPSDFQDYTLVALFVLAAHLTGGAAAERATLPTMSRFYQQDLEILQQVGRLSS